MRGFDFQENRGYLGIRSRWMNHPMVLSCQLLSGLWYVIAIRVYRNLTFGVIKCIKPLATGMHGQARPSTAKDVSGLIPSLLCSCLRISLVLSTHLLAWLGPRYSERKKPDHQPTAAEKQDLAGDFCWIAERRTRKPMETIVLALQARFLLPWSLCLSLSWFQVNPPKTSNNGHGRWESKGPKTGCCPQDSIQVPDRWLNYGLWIFMVDITWYNYV